MSREGEDDHRRLDEEDKTDKPVVYTIINLLGKEMTATTNSHKLLQEATQQYLLMPTCAKTRALLTIGW